MQTILLQDDPELLRVLERGILCRSDLRLVLAATSAEVVTRSQREAPVMVILDRDIAEGSPIALMDTLRALPAPPSCLIVEDEFVVDCDDGGEPRRTPIHDSICERLGITGRGSERQPLRCAARVQSGGDCRHGRTRDVSPSGAFVVTSTPYSSDTRVEVRLESFGDRTFAGRVVRAVEPAPGQECLPGMAIRFDEQDCLSMVDLDASTRAATDRGPG